MKLSAFCFLHVFEYENKQAQRLVENTFFCKNDSKNFRSPV